MSGALTAKATDASPEFTGTFNFITGNFQQFVSVTNSGSFDEVRYGSTLADVAPIPEPGSAAMLLCGSGLLALRRRRLRGRKAAR